MSEPNILLRIDGAAFLVFVWPGVFRGVFLRTVGLTLAAREYSLDSVSPAKVEQWCDRLMPPVFLACLAMAITLVFQVPLAAYVSVGLGDRTPRHPRRTPGHRLLT